MLVSIIEVQPSR